MFRSRVAAAPWAALFAAWIATATSPALAQSGAAAPSASTSNYAGFQLGRNDADRWPGSVNFGGPSVAGSLDLERGWQGGVFGGRDFGRWRAEVEYQHGRLGLQGASLGPVSGSASGRGQYDMLTVGAYGSVPLAASLSAFGGAAVGAARVRLPQASFPGCACFSEASETGFAGQLRAGLELAAGPGKAFVHVSRLRLPGPGGGGTPSVDYDDRYLTTWGVGYRHAF